MEAITYFGTLTWDVIEGNKHFQWLSSPWYIVHFRSPCCIARPFIAPQSLHVSCGIKIPCLILPRSKYTYVSFMAAVLPQWAWLVPCSVLQGCICWARLRIKLIGYVFAFCLEQIHPWSQRWFRCTPHLNTPGSSTASMHHTTCYHAYIDLFLWTETNERNKGFSRRVMLKFNTRNFVLIIRFVTKQSRVDKSYKNWTDLKYGPVHVG